MVGVEAGLLAFTEENRRMIVHPKPLKAQLVQLDLSQPSVPKPAPPSMVAPSVTPAEEKQEPEETQEEQLARIARERAERLRQLRESAFQELVDDEISRETDQAVRDLAQMYIEGIYLSLVTNWSRPPSARNNMSAIIQLELFPNGEINSVVIVETSGNESFDRSALTAVRSAAPFDVPEDLDLFEARFRSLTLNFRPQDLLR